MSVRPLDLQVNINTSHTVSKQETAKVALAAATQREINEKNQKDGISDRNTVVKTNESSDSESINKDEVKRKKDNLAQRHKKKREKPTSSKSETSEDEPNNSDDKNHILNVFA